MIFFQDIKDWFRKANERGIAFPFARDAVEKRPSASLFYAQILFYAMLGSLIWYHLNDTVMGATILTCTMWTIAQIFVKMKNLTKFTADLDDRSISLEDETNPKEERNEK